MWNPELNSLETLAIDLCAKLNQSSFERDINFVVNCWFDSHANVIRRISDKKRGHLRWIYVVAVVPVQTMYAKTYCWKRISMRTAFWRWHTPPISPDRKSPTRKIRCYNDPMSMHDAVSIDRTCQLIDTRNTRCTDDVTQVRRAPRISIHSLAFQLQLAYQNWCFVCLFRSKLLIQKCNLKKWFLLTKLVEKSKHQFVSSKHISSANFTHDRCHTALLFQSTSFCSFCITFANIAHITHHRLFARHENQFFQSFRLVSRQHLMFRSVVSCFYLFNMN